ncbi:hypothetical protein DFQ28_001768 [Apophysomyces sp. BC1034]|nr:hypothetical protein DFQ28_001768 [Apophysomyces sp. BC1034]
MSSPKSKCRPPFVTLPRHKRSNEVIRLKGKMRRDAAEYGGRFTSHLVLNEPGRPDLYNQWFDFHFPGTDRFTIWNAGVVTARQAFWDAAHNEAFSRACAQLGDTDLDKESKLEFEPADVSRTGKILTYRMVKRESVRYAQFDGRTLSEQVDLLEAKIIRDAPPAIHESFKLDRSYVYGIGLRIVLDVEVINQAAIESAIDRFVAVSETDWVSPAPVLRDRLPLVSEREALASVDFPSVQIEMPVR